MVHKRHKYTRIIVMVNLKYSMYRNNSKENILISIADLKIASALHLLYNRIVHYY